MSNPSPTLLSLLTRDLLDETQGDDVERAWRRGWNRAIKHVETFVRAQTVRVVSEADFDLSDSVGGES